MSRRPAARALSCGVLVTDGAHLLIGHATRTPRWDIPKGLAEPGEVPEGAARRELLEETGLHAPPSLVDLGQFGYRPGKDLWLFVWRVDAMPDPASLICRSTFTLRGEQLPEFDRFACPDWADALVRLGSSMATVLKPVAERAHWFAKMSACAVSECGEPNAAQP